MTDESNSNDFERSDNENQDWRTETREWSAAATELACFPLARMKNKNLIEIIDTKRGTLRFICIFKDKDK